MLTTDLRGLVARAQGGGVVRDGRGLSERELLLAAFELCDGAEILGMTKCDMSMSSDRVRDNAPSHPCPWCHLRAHHPLLRPRVVRHVLRDPRLALHSATVDPGIFRAYDVRGVVGRTLNVQVAELIGQAIGSAMAEQGLTEVVVGRDGRLSGPALCAGLIEGLRKAGRDVIDIGIGAHLPPSSRQRLGPPCCFQCGGAGIKSFQAQIANGDGHRPLLTEQ